MTTDNKIAEYNDDEIITNVLFKIGNPQIISDVLNEMVDKITMKYDIDNMFVEVEPEKKKNKFEKAERKIIQKIYDKFKIKPLKKDVIDFVYTHINYNESDYMSLKNEEIKSEKYLRQRGVDNLSGKLLHKFLEEDKKFRIIEKVTRLPPTIKKTGRLKATRAKKTKIKNTTAQDGNLNIRTIKIF